MSGSSSLLDGKRLLVTGVATPDSIATATARACLEQGARIVLTAFPRDIEAARAVAADLDPTVPVLSLDLTDRGEADAVATQAAEQLGGLDGALHAVAFAPRTALHGPFTEADPADVELAFRTSAWTLAELARVLAVQAPPSGASLVALDFDADDRAWPLYNWMGVCKAALRSTARYLARDLGPAGIRVNLVAAGPLRTRAGSAIPGFERLLEAWDTTSALPWDASDPAPVADTACFLFSDLARAITAEVLHVDGGYHAMATRLRDADPPSEVVLST
ncbi:MAG: SDR family oxidoreductase [Acidimicrobiales bacterium]|nr:SDR family oxidoreductase [Acidimicrobiales bacterium]